MAKHKQWKAGQMPLKISKQEMMQLDNAAKLLQQMLDGIHIQMSRAQVDDSKANSKDTPTNCTDCGFTCTGHCRTSCWAQCGGCGGCDFTCEGKCKSSCYAYSRDA